MNYNAIRLFKTEDEARAFAEQVGSNSWGWTKSAETGEIVNWYVDYNI